MKQYRVCCKKHHYDTVLANLPLGTAVDAARMHALLPCTTVEVTDEQGKVIDWRADA